MTAPSRARVASGAVASAASRIGVPVEDYRQKVAAGLRFCHGHQDWHPASAFGWRTGYGGRMFRPMPSCPEGHRLASREGMRRMRERRRAGACG